MESLNLSPNNVEDFTIRIDLSVECWSYVSSMNHLGYLTTEFVQEMVNTFPSLYALTMILKQYLQNRNLLNIYQGMYLIMLYIYRNFNTENFLQYFPEGFVFERN